MQQRAGIWDLRRVAFKTRYYTTGLLLGMISPQQEKAKAEAAGAGGRAEGGRPHYPIRKGVSLVTLRWAQMQVPGQLGGGEGGGLGRMGVHTRAPRSATMTSR